MRARIRTRAVIRQVIARWQWQGLRREVILGSLRHVARWLLHAISRHETVRHRHAATGMWRGLVVLGLDNIPLLHIDLMHFSARDR